MPNCQHSKLQPDVLPQSRHCRYREAVLCGTDLIMHLSPFYEVQSLEVH